ncbi:MAG: NADH-quinone oxidoreductase subunit K [Bacteroidia bacterium]|nr:NADH-quinone oxidoreductase subunit K [Bacteroidia bacterium]MDW8089122.1 NADH-quinone oxidoreductase subunit K [Bacteroidia bacterium]
MAVWLSLAFFAAGIYLVISRPHPLWLLVGLELLFNAAAPLLLLSGTPEAIGLLLLMLLFALLEGAVALFLFYHLWRSSGQFSLENLLVP